MSDRSLRRGSAATEAERVVTFPRGAWAALAITGLLLVGGIVTQVILVEDQRRTTRDQRALLQRQLDETLPLIRATRPLVRDTRPLVRATRENAPRAARTARRVSRLAASAAPLIDELRRIGLGQTARAVEATATVLLEADLAPTLRVARELASQLLRANPGETIGQIEEATESVPYLASIQRRTFLLQRQTFRAQRRAVELQEQTVAIAREQLQVTRDTKRTADETLAVARETERHAESLDRKLGGPVPGATVP